MCIYYLNHLNTAGSLFSTYLANDVRGLEYERQPVAAYYLPYQITQQLEEGN